MKIQCDVCGSAEASVFCCADEAALCDPCDCRVHRANKLAGKHRRFSLLQPTTTSSSSSPRSLPLCDVCQERRGFVFCQEDRAILCRDCDAPIHTATSLTMKHSRFLITGASLSSAPIPSSSPPDAEAEVTSSKTYKKDQEKALALEAALLSTAAVTSSSAVTTTTTATDDRSSISEYLMKMLPGWHVEDFLTDDSSATTAAADGFCPVDEVTPFLEAEELPIWVPCITPVNHPVPVAAAASGGEFHPGPGLARLKEASPSQSQHRQSRRRWSEDAYAVPQIQHVCGVNKRSRPNIWYF